MNLEDYEIATEVPHRIKYKPYRGKLGMANLVRFRSGNYMLAIIVRGGQGMYVWKYKDVCIKVSKEVAKQLMDCSESQIQKKIQDGLARKYEEDLILHRWDNSRFISSQQDEEWEDIPEPQNMQNWTDEMDCPYENPDDVSTDDESTYSDDSTSDDLECCPKDKPCCRFSKLCFFESFMAALKLAYLFVLVFLVKIVAILWQDYENEKERIWKMLGGMLISIFVGFIINHFECSYAQKLRIQAELENPKRKSRKRNTYNEFEGDDDDMIVVEMPYQLDLTPTMGHILDTDDDDENNTKEKIYRL